MNEKQIVIILDILPWIISLFSFLLIYFIAGSFHPAQYIIRTYERINNRLKEQKNGLFDYENIRRFLLANGAPFHYGSKISPVNYMLARLIIAAGAFLAGIQFHWLLSIVLVIAGFQLPAVYLIRANKKDNDALLRQIQTLYSTLMIQIKAGVYVTDALTECYQNFKRGRLRTALEEMATEFFINKSFEDVLDHFNEKFNNTFIDSLCVTLKQAQESGQAVDLLADMSEQVKGMKAARLLKKKEALDRTNTFCLLGIVAAIMVVIMYACITEMFGSANAL